MNMMVNMVKPEEVKDLREQFQAIDTAGTGMIECTELAEILKKMDMEVNEEDLEHIISEVDYYNNKKINYSDFLSATVPIRTFMTEHRLQAIFQQFDTDNSG